MLFGSYVLFIRCKRVSPSSSAVAQVGKLRHIHTSREVLEAAAPQPVLGAKSLARRAPDSREFVCAGTRQRVTPAGISRISSSWHGLSTLDPQTSWDRGGACSDRTRSNSLKLKEGRFRGDVRKT